MWPRFTLDDLRVIGHYLGYIIVLIGVLMAIPLAISLFMGEYEVTVNYAFGMGVSLAVGFSLALLKINPSILKRRQAAVIAALAWVVCSLVAAIPLYLSGHFASYGDAVFDAMSAFTTTGFVLATDLEHMSLADTMWRYILPFVGGLGVIVVALAIGAFARSVNRTSLYDAEGRHDHVMPEIKQTAQFILKFSIAVVLIGGVAIGITLMAVGFDPPTAFFHGICMTIGAYDTVGITTNAMGVGYYHSWPMEIVYMFVMLIGAINFGLHYRISKGKIGEFFHSTELRTFAVWIAALVALVSVMICVSGQLDDLDALLRKVPFMVVSAVTNTGAQTIEPGQLNGLVGSGVMFLLTLGMAIGGMSNSTSGGIKIFRLSIVCKEIVLRMKQSLSPDSARMTATYNNGTGKKPITQAMLGSALVVASLYMISYLVGAVVAMGFGYDMPAALMESVSMGSNSGISAGIVSPDMPDALMVVYIIQMWLGRLEFLTVLAFVVALVASVMPKKGEGRLRR